MKYNLPGLHRLFLSPKYLPLIICLVFQDLRGLIKNEIHCLISEKQKPNAALLCCAPLLPLLLGACFRCAGFIHHVTLFARMCWMLNAKSFIKAGKRGTLLTHKELFSLYVWPSARARASKAEGSWSREITRSEGRVQAQKVSAYYTTPAMTKETH